MINCRREIVNCKTETVFFAAILLTFNKGEKQLIDAREIRDILSLYRKYGWTLERILLTQDLRERVLAALSNDFGTAEIVSSEIDAAWFSRPANNGGETWELRHLSINPYALLEVFEPEDLDDVREEALMEIEERLKETLGKKKKESH